MSPIQSFITVLKKGGEEVMPTVNRIKKTAQQAVQRRRAQKIDTNQYKAQGNQGFWFVSGRTINGLSELCDAIQTLSKEQFEYHVNAEKNDFANWVGDVFGLNDLAADVRRQKSVRGLVQLLKRRFQ